MKRIAAFLMAVVMLAAMTACDHGNGQDTVSEADAAPDYSIGSMVVNGTFDDEATNLWGLYSESQGKGTVSIKDGALVLDAEDAGKLSYALQLYYDGVSVNKGASYVFQFDISTSLPEKSVDVMVQYNGGNYDKYVFKTIMATPEVTTFTIPFTMNYASDPAPRVCFNCGRADAGPETTAEIPAYTITVDNIYLTCTDPGSDTGLEEKSRVNVNLNQIGYRPNDSKIAIMRGEETGGTFDVYNTDGEIVYSGELSEPVENITAGEVDRYADFTELTEPGEYRIVTEEHGDSMLFTIGEDVYDEAFSSVLSMLRRQRCGCELTEEEAGEFAHPACHTGEAIIYGTDERIDVSGGWHDAGDFGRYVVPGAKAAMDLMLSYEEAPELFADDSDDVIDILEEVRWELDWMLKMQADNGGVYHKVTCLNFPGEVMPEEETEQLYVCPISNCATADFAAVMAHASTVYEDKEFAKTCLDAAKKAWAYLEKEPSNDGFHNPSDVLTGEYPDAQDIDERYWAACELLAATGDKKYSDSIKDAIETVRTSRNDDDETNDIYMDDLGWTNVGFYGTIAFLSMDKNSVDADMRNYIESQFRNHANWLVSLCETDGYMISMGSNYYWGSNMGVMNNAMKLLFADKFIGGTDDYTYYARQHLNYIFGANPMATSYVTGFGTISPEHTHHRPSQAKDVTMPGMLVGGPNGNLEDPYAQAVLANQPPAICYVDNEQSYSCNEICIYWNSPLVYVMTVCCEK